MCSDFAPATPAGGATDSRWDGPVPLSQVLSHVRPAYGGNTWDEALAYLHATPSEACVIGELSSSGADGFNEPIRIYRDEPDFDDPEDVAEFVADELGREWVLGNGMHRVATAVLLGHHSIDCSTALSSQDSDADTEYVEVQFTLPGDWPQATANWSDGLDDLDWACGWIRSFALPGGTWVEGDAFSSLSGTLSAMWSCPSTHADLLIAELVRRYREHGPGHRTGDFTCLKVRTYTGAEWDAEYEAGLQER